MEHPTQTAILQPSSSEYSSSYSSYIQLVTDHELIKGFSGSLEHTLDFLTEIPEEKRLFTYQPGKWTIQQVVQHLMDTERIFAYRALRFSRNDSTVLSSFDEDFFAQNCESNSRNWGSMVDEYRTVRLSTLALFQSFSMLMLDKMGTVGKNQLSVRALGFTILGHEIHHFKIIRDRYLTDGFLL